MGQAGVCDLRAFSVSGPDTVQGAGTGTGRSSLLGWKLRQLAVEARVESFVALKQTPQTCTCLADALQTHTLGLYVTHSYYFLRRVPVTNSQSSLALSFDCHKAQPTSYRTTLSGVHSEIVLICVTALQLACRSTPFPCPRIPEQASPFRFNTAQYLESSLYSAPTHSLLATQPCSPRGEVLDGSFPPP